MHIKKRIKFYFILYNIFTNSLFLRCAPDAVLPTLCFVAVLRLRSFASDSTRKLDIFRHDGHTFGVDGAQIGVFEKTDQISF